MSESYVLSTLPRQLIRRGAHQGHPASDLYISTTSVDDCGELVSDCLFSNARGLTGVAGRSWW